MAWRPTEYLLEGELDNTTPGKVTGWMRFAGMKNTVTFNLRGDFHRDIRGSRIRFKGPGDPDDPKAAKYMEGFAEQQTGEAGDITAGLEPRDYVAYPYLEWYSEQNGRIVLELERGQVEVIGKPIPACECDPVSGEKQAEHMMQFIAGLSPGAHLAVVAVAGKCKPRSDPNYSHWVQVNGHIIGEAHSVKSEGKDECFAFVRLFNMPENAEYGYVPTSQLRIKNHASQN